MAKRYGIPKELASTLLMLGENFNVDEQLLRWPRERDIIGHHYPLSITLYDM